MSHTVSWLLEDRIVLSHLRGELSTSDIQEVYKKSQNMFKFGQVPIHYLIDLRHTHDFPMNVLDVLPVIPDFWSDQHNWIIVLTNNPLVNSITTVIADVHEMNVKTYNSLHDGLNFLVSQDHRLASRLFYDLPQIKTA